MWNGMPSRALCRSRQYMFAAVLAAALCIVFVPANVRAQGPESWEALRDRAVEQDNSGDIASALATQKKVVAIAKTRFSSDDPRLALEMLNLASMLRDVGRYNEANTTLQEVLDLPGARSTYRAKAYIALGVLALDLGDLINAEKYLAKASEISKSGNDSIRLILLTAELRNAQGKYTEAEKLYLDVINTLEPEPQGLFAELSTAFNNLALLLKMQGRFLQAEQFFKKAIVVDQHNPHEGVKGRLVTLANLGSLYRAMGRYDEARRYLVEAQVLAEQRFGPESIHVASALDHLCLLQRDEEDYDLAARTCERALAIRKKVNGEDSAAYLNTLGNAADVWVKQGKTIRAGRAYETVLKRARAQYGEDSPKLVRAYNDMGAYLHQNGHLEEAETWLRKALSLLKRDAGADPLREAAIRGNLANVYRDRKQYKAALQEYQAVLKLRRDLLGENHVTVVHTLVDMGVLYHRQGRPDDAQRYYQQALRAAEAGLWPEHPQVLLIRQYLAALKAGKGVPGE